MSKILEVQYITGEKKRIVFDKTIKMTTNHMFSSLNVVDEDNNQVFYSSLTLIKSAVILDSTTDKIHTIPYGDDMKQTDE